MSADAAGKGGIREALQNGVGNPIHSPTEIGSATLWSLLHHCAPDFLHDSHQFILFELEQ